MATPQASDLVYYTNTPLTDTDWATNWNKSIAWLTDTTFDFSINDLTLAGDLVVAGTGTFTGAVTANSFSGDGSSLTGLDISNKNYVTNGISSVKEASDYTLVKDVFGTGFIIGLAQDLGHYGMATGTAVSAGTMSQTTSANCGSTSYAFKYAGVTLTGTGIIYHRYRMQSKDAVNLINQSVSFGVRVYHDTGSTINYTITINKADGIDNFSAVTQIDTGITAVLTATETKLELEDVSMGNCFNGVEIIIKMETGAITTKNYELTELQLEISTTSTTYEFKTFKAEAVQSMFNFDGSIMQCGGFLGCYDTESTTNGRIYVSATQYMGANSDTQILFSVGGSTRFTVDATANISTSAFTAEANLLAQTGVLIGTAVSDKRIDDSTNGGSSTALFIGNGTIALTSDIRLKENIENTKIDCLKLINDLRVVDFDWNDEVKEGDSRKTRGRYMGMVAQEMIKVAPWTIHHQGGKDCELCKAGKECSEHPVHWQAEYEYLVPALVKAMQVLNIKIDSLARG